MHNQCFQSRGTLKKDAETGYSNISQVRLEDEGMVSVLVTSRACRRAKRVVDVLGRLQDTLG